MISEGLIEPSVINEFSVFKATISRSDLELGEGRRGRWHIYHVYATDSQLASLTQQVRLGWYCHFWRGEELAVIFPSKRFNIKAHDRSTRKAAVEYGRSIGIPENELDFPTS